MNGSNLSRSHWLPALAALCLFLSSCGDDSSPSTDDASPESIECIGISKPPTGDLERDLVGTWVTNLRYIDSFAPVLRLSSDGEGQLIQRPTNGELEGPAAGDVGDTTWTVTGNTVDVEFVGTFELWRLNPSTAQFSDSEAGVTWYRVDCKGFGFADEFEEMESSCADDPSSCESLEPPATCLTYSDHWGQVSACGYETIP